VLMSFPPKNVANAIGTERKKRNDLPG
jgi:hypothetical protein